MFFEFVKVLVIYLCFKVCLMVNKLLFCYLLENGCINLDCLENTRCATLTSLFVCYKYKKKKIVVFFYI